MFKLRCCQIRLLVFRYLKIGMVFPIFLFIVGCSATDERKAVFMNLGMNAILVKPPLGPPEISTKKYKQNDFFFIPGSLVKPRRILANIDFDEKLSEVWAKTGARFCTPSNKQYSLWDLPSRKIPDIKIRYDFEASPKIFARAFLELDLSRLFRLSNFKSQRETAVKKFRLNSNDIKRIKSIHIDYKNLREISVIPEKQLEIRKQIAEKCPHLAHESQIRKAYVGDISIELFDAKGVSVNLGIIKGKIQRVLAIGYRGSNQFFAIKVARNIIF